MSLSRIGRRTFLQSAGAALSLPWMESVPTFAQEQAPPQRMVAICSDMGMIPEFFFPKQAGRDYQLSPHLLPLSDLKNDFTVFSGVSHPEVDGGHQTDVAFLTAAPHPVRAGFRNTISIDQYAAARIGHETRCPSLNLRVGPGDGSISFTSDGVRNPAEMYPSEVFKQLFVQGSSREVRRQVQRLREGQSVMDSFANRIQSMRGYVSSRDQRRLEQFCTSVRETERRLMVSEAWEKKPKPQVDAEVPEDFDQPGQLIKRSQAMYDLAKLAIETDSTRIVTIFVTQLHSPRVDLPQVTLPHHALTHQTTLPESRTQLQRIERAQMKVLGDFLSGLKSADEGGQSLLDRTCVLYGSNLSNANRHDNTNLPVLLAGGGFQHGQHLAFDEQNNVPLSNVFVSMLNQIGIPTESFASSTGPMPGLERVA
ncbi:MAG: DUF1552 domain-containing protein [Planctomycetaceae bacterium]|nr:DUF1552 domain-containing protein [Planctomycetaceae bacterium]